MYKEKFTREWFCGRNISVSRKQNVSHMTHGVLCKHIVYKAIPKTRFTLGISNKLLNYSVSVVLSADSATSYIHITYSNTFFQAICVDTKKCKCKHAIKSYIKIQKCFIFI